MSEERNWIVVAGQPIDTTRGGGFEFFGPFTKEEANRCRTSIITHWEHQHSEDSEPYTMTGDRHTMTVIAVQLLHYRVHANPRVVSRSPRAGS